MHFGPGTLLNKVSEEFIYITNTYFCARHSTLLDTANKKQKLSLEYVHFSGNLLGVLFAPNVLKFYYDVLCCEYNSFIVLGSP